MTAPAKLELVELDIDMRLHDLWADLHALFPDIANDRDLCETFGVFFRAAYGRGYMDALKDKGELLKQHGYTMPAK